ncbi:deoxyguanosinetriphosphate triphosphohydrolase family protein [Echinimonas agarilytica]|uniref:Deoxyguanosinetriphosphate triphosphohydrolase-like protein n=1 Tax=Echinimonas agarilytica TaxID=1215918 RepID=A0AA41W7S8_9GAMM|nr:anti-phage deoxyguanosine triphosphatase [Echinimonas agarilytica]MCM2680847.1 deoxyguanosinetriphosphate triphosphohydrolase family protein [Echinimonas agarilytica]
MVDIWQQRCSEEYKARRHDHRSAYQRDRARVLHSAAFRRLQAKTQIHGVGSSDFYRTRLTHSLEAGQIGQGIHEQLGNKYPQHKRLLGPAPLIETLCLAHDLGHPPFGHGGETALHYMMRNHGGFEGNGQTFRIVTRLEPYTQSYGMNLARRTLLGLVKYPVTMSQVTHISEQPEVSSARDLRASDWHPAKALYNCDQDWIEWLLSNLTPSDRAKFTQAREIQGSHNKARYKSLDCSIMELADDIAYGIHDLEDAITLKMVNREQWSQAEQRLKQIPDEWLQANIEAVSQELFSNLPFVRKNAIGALVNYFITAIELVDDLPFEEVLLSHNAKLPTTAAAALKEFKVFVFDYVIRSHQVQTAEYKGQQMIMALFEAYESDPERLLPEEPRAQWLNSTQEDDKMRVIADWVSSLTDQSATRIYHELFA